MLEVDSEFSTRVQIMYVRNPNFEKARKFVLISWFYEKAFQILLTHSAN